MLLLLVTFLPIVTSNNLAANKGARKLALRVAGLIVSISVSMEGSGAVISIVVKIGLLLKGQGG